jgi:hypothetical protein
MIPLKRYFLSDAKNSITFLAASDISAKSAALTTALALEQAALR